jgi:CHAT domain-containing protein
LVFRSEESYIFWNFDSTDQFRDWAIIFLVLKTLCLIHLISSETYLKMFSVVNQSQSQLRLIILLLTINTPFAFAQPTSSNLTDPEGRRQGQWTVWFDLNWRETTIKDSVEFYRQITYKNDIPHGMVRDYFKNGKLQFEGSILSDRPENILTGSATWHWLNGISAQATYVNGAQIDSLKLFDQNGNAIIGNWEKIRQEAIVLYDSERYELAIAKLEIANVYAELFFGKQSQNYLGILLRLGKAHYALGNFEKAKPLMKQMIQEYGEAFGKTTAVYGNLLFNLGDTYCETSEYLLAEPLLKQAKYILQKYSDNAKFEYARVLDALGVALSILGKYSEAEIEYLLSIESFKKASGTQTREYARVLRNLGSFYIKIGNYEKAKQFYVESMDLVEKILGTSHPDYFRSLRNLAIALRWLGQTDDAYTLATKCLQLTRRAKEKLPLEFARSLSYMAVLEIENGNYGLADKYLGEAIPVLKLQIGIDYWEAFRTWATNFAHLGNFIKAKQQLHKVRNSIIERAGSMNEQYLLCLNDLSVLYEKLAEYDSAMLIQKELLKLRIDQGGKSHPEYFTTLNNLGRSYQELGQYDSALRCFEEASHKFPDKQTPGYVSVLGNLASTYHELGNYTKEEFYYKKAVTIAQTNLNENHPNFIQSINNLAWFYFQRNELSKAEPLFLESAGKKIKELRRIFPALSENERLQYYQDNTNFIYNFESFCFARYAENPSIAAVWYNLRLASKSILFNVSQNIRQKIGLSRDTSLLRAFGDWRASVNLLQKAYQTPRDKFIAQANTLEELESRVNALEKKLGVFFLDNTWMNSQRWQDVQAQLKNDEYAIEIVKVLNSSQANHPWVYAALAISGAEKVKPKLFTIGDAMSLETKYYNYYRNTLATGVEDSESWSRFWKPISREIGHAKKAYLSLDGIYHKINLNTLRNPDTGEYLSETIDIAIVGNTKDLIESSARNATAISDATLVGFPDFNKTVESEEKSTTNQGGTQREFRMGNQITRFLGGDSDISELPGTKAEIENISSLLSNKGVNVTIYSGGKALEENLKELQSPQILHIATHGFFLPDNSMAVNQTFLGMKATPFEENPLMRSGLLLAGAKFAINGSRSYDLTSEDGVLTAYEALTLDLNRTELVVLSACETGLGVDSNGEGIYGLQRSLQIAGAKNIIMSLWKVDDQATMEFMTHFYTYWVTTKSKRMAFSKAQKIMKEKYVNEPIKWGAFVLIGN